MSDVFERARAAIELGRPQLALQGLSAALADDPSDAALRALRGFACWKTGDFLEAQAELQAALGLNPELTFAFLTLASIQTRLGQFEEARRNIEEALRLDSASEIVWEVLASLEYRANQPQAALDATEAGLRINPRSLSLLLLRTEALRHLGRPLDAQAVAREALAIAPDHADVLAALGWALIDQRQHRAALVPLAEGLRLRPSDPYVRSGFITAFRAQSLWRRCAAFIGRGPYLELCVMPPIFLSLYFLAAQRSPAAGWVLLAAVAVWAVGSLAGRFPDGALFLSRDGRRWLRLEHPVLYGYCAGLSFWLLAAPAAALSASWVGWLAWGASLGLVPTAYAAASAVTSTLGIGWLVAGGMQVVLIACGAYAASALMRPHAWDLVAFGVHGAIALGAMGATLRTRRDSWRS